MCVCKHFMFFLLLPFFPLDNQNCIIIDLERVYTFNQNPTFAIKITRNVYIFHFIFHSEYIKRADNDNDVEHYELLRCALPLPVCLFCLFVLFQHTFNAIEIHELIFLFQIQKRCSTRVHCQFLIGNELMIHSFYLQIKITTSVLSVIN